MLRRRCVSCLVLPYLKSRPGKHKAQAFQKGCYAYYLQHEARSTKTSHCACFLHGHCLGEALLVPRARVSSPLCMSW
jgi:hypothetical protein